MKSCIAALLLSAGSAFAQCPDAPDITDDLASLIKDVRAAPNEMAAREISGLMWELWLKAPDSAAQEALDKGLRRLSSYDFLGAIEQYTRLIAYCPSYAEGYNQRAYIYFLKEDFPKALVDLDVALELSPNHVGALSGRALTLMNLGQLDAARKQMLAALEINPWLSERYLLLDGGPLAPMGEDI